MKILPLLLISLVLCNVSIKNQNSAISVFKCLLTDEKFIGSLKNIISSLREHLEDKDVLALIKSLLENVPVALKEIKVCLNSEPVLQSWWNDFVDKVNDIRNPGYPLDSMSIMPSVNKYFVELTKEEKDSLNRNNNEEDVIEFLEKSIMKLTK